MPDREGLYLQLPVFLQHAACSLEGWRIARTRYNAAFERKLEAARQRTFWGPEQIAEFRDQRLREFVWHAATTVPFYRRQFRELQISPDDIGSLADLRRLPVLARRQVQENPGDFVSETVPMADRRMAHTSGTTGAGLRFATTDDAVREQWAAWWRYRQWHGINPGTWCGYFGGRSLAPLSQKQPPFWRYNYPGRQVMFSAYHVSPANLPHYIAELRRRRLEWLHGYPSILALVAAHLAENQLDLGYRVRWVTTGAENLLEGQAALIERAFGVKPIQHYGMAEAVANISQCERGALHVDEDFAAAEFVDDPDTGAERIVGTNFSNPATPLLRYDTQDYALRASSGCACGRSGRTVLRIDGRREDYIVLANGARLGRLDHIFKDARRVREAQLVQRRPGGIVVRVVKGEGYTASDEQALEREFRRRVGGDCELSFEYVAELPRGRTGKLRFVVSEIPGGHTGTSAG